jgi:hypothetical protein
MSNSFKITYKWEKRSEPYRFDEEDYIDWTRLFTCLRRFLALYDGTFRVRINEFDLHFDLEPDFSTIFEELPDVLETLKANTDSPAELHLFEQGTDLIFWLERQADTISIRMEKGPSVGSRFADLPESVFSVPANVFLKEWIRFTKAVLDALVELQPDLTGDESYQEYRNRLLAVEKAVGQ